MANYIVGARIVFRINGEKVASATAVSFNRTFENEPVDILDQITTEEYVYTGFRVDFSCDLFRIADKSVTQMGLWPALDEVFTKGVLTAEFVDRVTGKTLALITGVKAVGNSGNIAARAAARETINFVGTKMKDEGEL